MNRIVIQGSKFGPISCACEVDKLGKSSYKNGKPLFSYKNTVQVPPLGMIDDIVAATECESDTFDSITTNAVINKFIESKKLEFGPEKCHQLHVGSASIKNRKCQTLRVHGDEMKRVEKEKYVGDILNSSGCYEQNIEERRKRGFGSISEILSILREVPLGQYRLQVGLKLRESMFLGAILCNSEVWYLPNDNVLSKLEEVDEHLLRQLLSAQATVSRAALYLETAATPIRFLVKSRRLMYLHHILSRSNEELIRKVFEAQKRKTVKNDWVNIIKRDCADVKITFSESQIMSLKKYKFKAIVKERIQNSAFDYLIGIKENQSKLKEIKYKKFETQKYLMSNELSNEEKFILFRIRTRTIDDIKTNFRNKYGKDLRCRFGDSEEESQSHQFVCPYIVEECDELRKNKDVKYEDFFGNIEAQIPATRLYKKILEARQKLLKAIED